MQETDTQSRITYLPIGMVEPDRAQPRKVFQEEALQSLADSIREHGILEPLLVVRMKGYYRLVAGERRWRAARMAGLKTVPVIIRGDMTDKESAEIALIENIQREDLNPVEEAEAYRSLMERFHLSADEVASRVGKARPSIVNAVRILKLPNPVLRMVSSGELSMGQAKAILSAPEDRREALAEEAAGGHLSVREVEKRAAAESGPAKKKKKRIPAGRADQDAILSDELSRKTGLKTVVRHQTDGTGTLTVRFASDEDLDALYEALLSIRNHAN